MGSALTVPLTEKGHEVRLYGTEFDQKIMTALKSGKPHPSLDTKLPDTVRCFVADDLDEALDGAELILLAVTSEGILPVMNALLPFLNATVPLLTVAKGLLNLDGNIFCIGSGIVEFMKLKAVAEPPPVACLGGPSIAAELAAKTPTAVDLAATEDGLARQLASALSARRFVAHPVEDLRGLETCLAFKNVYAIALAWPAGLSENSPAGSMTNLKAILFLQVLDELEALIEAGGGDRRTARRFSGLGDLVATAEAGRNARFGRLLGGGRSAQDALDQMEQEGVQTIEGYEATRLGLKYVDSLGDLSLNHLPVLSAIHQVLYEDGSVEDCIDRLDLNAIARSKEMTS